MQDITLLNATYNDVPAVQLPKSGGGLASFTDVTDTTATASDVATGKYFYTSSGERTEGTASGGGGIDLSWLTASSPRPSVRNFFYALANGTVEHGEFTLLTTPTNAFITLFTMNRFSDQNPPQGVIVIDKAFYQGIDKTTLPNNGNNDIISFIWFDKSFLNPARDANIASEYPTYGMLSWSLTQTTTSSGGGGSANSLAFNGTTDVARGYYLFNGNDFTWKSRFGGKQYTTFVVDRTYIWIVY